MIAGIFIIIIGLAYILNKLIKKDFLVIKIFLYVFISLFIIYNFLNSTCIYMKAEKNSELQHYKRLVMDHNQINNIKKISQYVINSNKKVYILDAAAPYYMIPINRYNKNYDMFCLGNFGSKGEQGQIENLEQEKENIHVLIKNDKYKRNWQNPEQVRKWVINNMNKIGEMGVFDIYE